jgi:hypothetical protein
MERVVAAHRQLRCILWVAEAAIITICAITAVQVGTETHGSIWACGPIAIIAVMESMRVPLSGWAAHLRPLAMLGAFVVMAAIAFMTFEGMAMGVARFMDQRVHDVIEARTALEDIRNAQATAAADFDKATVEAASRRDALVKVQGQKADTVPVSSAQCGGGVNRYGQRQGTYACDGGAGNRNNKKAIENHQKQVEDAQKSLDEAEAQLKALPKPDPDAIKTAEKAFNRAVAGSTMYRVAAAWFGVSVNKLTDDQFERFRRLAIITVAGSTAVATMIVSFVSHATPRVPGEKGKLVHAIRAYLARKRKNVVRIVKETVEKPVEKIVEVEKHVVVDRPVIVEKRVDVPGPERIVVKHIHVPVDINTHRVVNADGTLGDAFPLHVVSGGKQ